VRRLAAAFLMTTFLRQKRRVDGLNAPEPEEKREPSGHAQGNQAPALPKRGGEFRRARPVSRLAWELQCDWPTRNTE
jgi:hypothetical protein